MIVIDQNFVKDKFDFVTQVHQDMIKDFTLKKLVEVSPLGLTVLQSAGLSVEDILERREIINSNLTEYDFKTDDDTTYKLENVSFI